MRNTHDKTRHQCPLCDHTSRVPSELKRHILYKHGTTKDYNCPYCKSQFKTVYDMNTHIYTQHQQLADPEAAFTDEKSNVPNLETCFLSVETSYQVCLYLRYL